MVIAHAPLFFSSGIRASFLDLACPAVVSFISTHKTISNVPVRKHNILKSFAKCFSLVLVIVMDQVEYNLGSNRASNFKIGRAQSADLKL